MNVELESLGFLRMCILHIVTTKTLTGEKRMQRLTMIYEVMTN